MANSLLENEKNAGNTSGGSTRKLRKARKHSSGVSIVEVIIALGILGFGVLGAAAAQITAVKFNRESRARTEAYYLAEQQMETFQAMSGSGVTAVAAAGPNDPLNPIDPDPNDGLTREFNRSWTITADATPKDGPEDGVFTIMVTVSWADAQGISRSVALESIKTDS